MSRLEYRLYAEGSDTFPLLYYYDRVARDETALRFACDYFVKDGKVYEKTSCAVEPACYVIYVKEAADERMAPWGQPNASGPQGVLLELREFRESIADYPLIHTYSFPDTLGPLLHLQADYLYADGREWQRTTTEIDEDRGTYVYYAVPMQAGAEAGT